MRGAVRNKKRWKTRRAPTQDPSTNNAHLREEEQLALNDGMDQLLQVQWYAGAVRQYELHNLRRQLAGRGGRADEFARSVGRERACVIPATRQGQGSA